MYEAELFSQRVRIEAAPELFSPSAADRGTLAMASQVELLPGQTLGSYRLRPQRRQCQP